MSLLQITLIVGVAGACGGILNAVQLTYRGLSTNDEAAEGPVTSSGPRKWVRDFGYCIVLGIAAAVLSWSLYGPYTVEYVIRNQPPEDVPPPAYNLTLGTLGTAIVIGLGGSRWLTNEVDKMLLQAAVVETARKPDNDTLSEKLIGASPEQVRNLAAAALLEKIS